MASVQGGVFPVVLHGSRANVQSGIRKQGGVASGRSLGNSLPFRMGQAGFFMKTGADHLVFMHDDRSHAGIRTCQPDPFFGQFYGMFIQRVS